MVPFGAKGKPDALSLWGNSSALNQTDASLKLWVGGLPLQASGDILREHFSQLQEPVLAEVLYPGVGCVAFDSEEAVAAAVSAFNHSDLNGSTIQVGPWAAKKGCGKGCDGKKGGAATAMPPQAAFDGGKGKKGKFDKGCGKMGWGMGAEWGDMMSMMMGMWGGGGKGWGGWDDASDGKGGSAGGRRKKGEDCPGVFKVTVAPSSKLVSQSFPREAPAIAHDKDYDSLFKQAHHVLGDLVGSIQEFCTIVHDPDWEEFPEVAKAVLAGGAPKECLAVATCPNAGKWAVGIAAGWKNRESSSKLALAVALAKDDQHILGQLRKAYPMFYSLCMTLQPQGNDGTWHATAGLGPSTPSAPSVHWLTLTEDSGITQEGFPPEAPCIVHGGKSDRDAFVNSHNVLCELMEDPGAVEYVDDPDGNVMPEVGEAMKAAECAEMPFTVAKSTMFAAWGVGVGSGWKFRETAAKLALGLSICGSTGKLEEFCEKYPEFAALCDKAGLVEAGLVHPPSKRRKVTPDANPVPRVTTPMAQTHSLR